MTKKELCEALAGYPDDAVIDVRIAGELPTDKDVTGIVDSTMLGNLAYVTLGIE